MATFGNVMCRSAFEAGFPAFMKKARRQKTEMGIPWLTKDTCKDRRLVRFAEAAFNRLQSNNLSASHRAALNALSFAVPGYGYGRVAAFVRRYLAYKAFKARHSHLDIRWCHNNHVLLVTTYRLRADWEKGKLPAILELHLRRIGFIFNLNESTAHLRIGNDPELNRKASRKGADTVFYRGLKRVVAKAKAKGHWRFPGGTEKIWCTRQRRRFRSGSLPARHLKALRAHKFPFRVDWGRPGGLEDKKHAARVRRLCKRARKTGSWDFLKKRPTADQRWAWKIRHQYRARTLSPAMRDLLTKAKFPFRIKTTAARRNRR